MRRATRRTEGNERARHLLLALVALGAVGVVACGVTPPRARFVMPPREGGTPAASATPATAEAVATPLAATEVPTPPSIPDVTIVAVGDIMLARRVTTLMELQGPTYPFERVRDLLEGDVTVGNMEGAFTERGTPLVKQYTFRTPPQLASALSLAGLDAVSLANNHATDFGVPGLEDTLGALEQAGVRAFGAGLDAERAAAPVVVRAENGARVAFLGVDDIGEVLWAGIGRPGVAPANLEGVRTTVEAACTEADYVVVFAHWGAEYSAAPTARQRELARAAVEAGASLVIGAHPHVLQPVERMDGSLVVYSLGNFVFDLDGDDMRMLGEGPFQAAVARITLSRSAPPRLEVAPVRTDPTEHRPRPATPDEAAAILDQLRELPQTAPAPR
ncbi:MAG: CapA family protein [Dehalococcoidia bacterium]|nr:CapA family protein [Dehalococcoidia bacterium]